MHHIGHLGRVQNALGPLGNGADAVLLVVDLVQHSPVHADHVALHLPRHHQYRRGCGVGGADAGSRVEQSRPRHHQRRANAASGAGITVGHVGGCLLVPGGDEPDAGFVVQRVHGVVQLDSGQAEDYPYPLQVEGLHQGLAAGHLSHSLPLQLDRIFWTWWIRLTHRAPRLRRVFFKFPVGGILTPCLEFHTWGWAISRAFSFSGLG